MFSRFRSPVAKVKSYRVLSALRPAVKHIILATAITAALLGCASQKPATGEASSPSKKAPEAPELPSVRLAAGKLYRILPPDGIETPLDMAQYIQGRYGLSEFALDSWVKADDQGVVILLFNAMGADMGEFTFQNGKLRFSSPHIPALIPAAYILADFQLCFYREDLLRENLEAAGLTFEVLDDDTTRRVLDKDKTIIEITKTIGQVRYVNNSRGYSFTLTGDFND